MPVILGRGGELTVTTNESSAVQKPSEPDTEYVVVEDGFTLMEVVMLPVFHKYERPPLAVKAAVSPVQMLLSPVIFIFGNELTVTVKESVSEIRQLGMVTVTEYTDKVKGLTEMEALADPVFHK